MDLDPSATRSGPIQVAVALVLCTAIGAVAGAYLVDTDWDLGRKVLLGAAIGAWCALMITARRLMM